MEAIVAKENKPIIEEIIVKPEVLLRELISKQLNVITPQHRLQITDLKRVSKKLSSSIFSNRCSLWKGYVTNINKVEKGMYINFFYNGKKSALHRLLYVNFVGDLSDNEYVKFTCENKGKCCNVNHLKKYYYNISEDSPKKQIREIKPEPEGTPDIFIVDLN